MRIKLVGIFVMMLLVAITLPVVGTMNTLDDNIDYQKIGDRGGVFRQLPSLPGNPMPYGLVSDSQMEWKVYEDFWEVSKPICHIHWWGQAVKWMNDTWHPGDPEGMIFDVTFFADDNGEPGVEVYSFENVTPLIVGTGIMYDYPDEWPDGPFELYHFEVDLGLCFDLSNGWVSIIKKYSPNDSVFGWQESQDGNDKLYQNEIERAMDVAFILAESGDPELEIEINSGLGVTVKVTNIGNETLTNIPIDIMVYGGMLGNINKQVRETIHLDPGDTASVGSGLFLGLGKIIIGIFADDVVEYKSGFQLIIFTKVK